LASAHNNLGLTFYVKGEFDDAIAEYRKAIERIREARHPRWPADLDALSSVLK